MVSYEGLGNLADGRLLFVGDFRALGRQQILFNHAPDRNWWVGTFDGGAQQFTWAHAGHTSFFGDLLGGHRFFVGGFSAADRDQLLFYNPSDQNWFLGAYSAERLGRLWWGKTVAGNTSGFGNLQGGHKLWHGRFAQGPGVLMYSPSDQRWWLSGYDAQTLKFVWGPAGRTQGFGNLLAGHIFWKGRFSQETRDEVLFYYPGDQNWWLGTYSDADREFKWSPMGATSFGPLPAGHRFWTGRFSQPNRDEVLFYNPSNQDWQLGTYSTAERKIKWKSMGRTTGFGNLLAGHKFWAGRFSAADRDQVLFYYPGDQNWWLSGHDAAAGKFTWANVSVTPNLADARAVVPGRFSRSDRAEVLVQDPDGRRWWLGGMEDNWGAFRWRAALDTERPRSNAASTALRSRLRELYGRSLPGCVFYVTRNGRAFADGSFGYARRPGAPDGELAMSSSTLVHVASVTKFFCAVAVLRLIEEWNGYLSRPASSTDPRLARTARAFNTTLSLDSKVFPLVRTYLDQTLVQSYGSSFPTAEVRNVTLRQLLDHTSGLPRVGADVTQATFVAALGGLRWQDVYVEPPGEGQARVDRPKYAAALLRQGATFAPNYNNDAYVLLAAVIEATTGERYSDWLKSHIFIEPRFDDLAPRSGDAARSASYHRLDGQNFTNGIHHPDYSDYTLAGGYYVSAEALADWVEALMRKLNVGGRPILNDPDLLFNARPGMPSTSLESFRGFEKNGGTGIGGGATNAKVAFMRGYGGERICAFVEANANVGADQLLYDGLIALAEPLSRRPSSVSPGANPTGVLRQTVYWDDAGALKSAAKDGAVDVQFVPVGGVNSKRTRLLGAGGLAGGRSTGDLVTVELRGSLRATAAGEYVFRLSSDDGAYLWLQDELIADCGDNHGPRSTESDAVLLELGAWYPLRVRWHNAGGGAMLCLEWKAPGAAGFTEIPAGQFAAVS